MSLVDSNTFIEPTAGTSLNSARSQYNNALRSLLTNFKSEAIPTATNIVASGAGLGEQDGMLFRSSLTNALYISDSVHFKSSPVGGNFTRVGVGNRVENGIVALAGNIASYEVGELVATPSASGALSGNARLYLKTGNASNMTDIVDVGIPPPNASVTNVMLAFTSITADRIKDGNVLLAKADFTTGAGDGGAGAAATLKISSAATQDTSIGFSTRATANVALIHVHGSTGVTAGLNLKDQGGAYAPMASNLALQSAIQGGTTAPVPLVPAGTMMAWAGANGSPPAGWLNCQGTAVSRTTYAALYAAIGVVFGGGNGSSTFNVPDTSGRALYGTSPSIAVGTMSGGVSGAGKVTTTSGSANLNTPTTQNFSTGAKDAGTAPGITAISFAGHTHDVTLPHCVVNWIIKT
jgi:hypothetical protein